MQDVSEALRSNGQGQYTLSAMIKLSSGTDTAILGLQISDSSGIHWIETSVGAVNSTEWTQISADVNVTWTGTLGSATFYPQTKGTLVNYNVDDASLKFGATELLANSSFDSVAPTVNIKMAEPARSIVAGLQGAQAGKVVFVENAYKLIANPGDWYLDKSAHVLYYKQTAGQDMSGLTVEVPVGSTGNRIMPQDILTRAQGASMIKRFLERYWLIK